MTAYTPAPWHVDGALVRDASGRVLLTVPLSFDRDGLAMAELIAAPELLATLRRVRTLIDGGYLRAPGWEELTLDEKAASKQQSVYDEIGAILRRIDGEVNP